MDHRHELLTDLADDILERIGDEDAPDRRMAMAKLAVELDDLAGANDDADAGVRANDEGDSDEPDSDEGDSDEPDSDEAE